jgi:hypothetical protein
MRTRNVYWHVTQAHLTAYAHESERDPRWNVDFYSPWALLFNTYEGAKQQVLNNLNKSVSEEVLVKDIIRRDGHNPNQVVIEYETPSHFPGRRQMWSYTLTRIEHESDVRVINEKA